jgi:hypothetical protein
MDYPNGFDIPAFPDMRKLALARAFAVWSCVAFFAIVVLCGALLWASQSLRLNPFLISVNQSTGEWTAVGEDDSGAGKLEYSENRAMQEFVIGNFVRRWFSISAAASENEIRWCRCDSRTECGTDRTIDQSGERKAPCLVCCASGDELFNRFVSEVLPDYKERAATGETWTLDEDSVEMTPLHKEIQNGGLWRVSAVVRSNKSGNIPVLGFAAVSRLRDRYPLSMGFFVSDFNGYSVSE